MTVNALQIRAKQGEEVIYRKDVTKGFFRKKVISAFLVTNYRVISPNGQQLFFEEIDDIETYNRRTERVANFLAAGPRTYGSGSTRTGSFAMAGRSTGTSVVIGDVHFLSVVKHDIIWRQVDDCVGLVRLVQ